MAHNPDSIVKVMIDFPDKIVTYGDDIVVCEGNFVTFGFEYQ